MASQSLVQDSIQQEDTSKPITVREELGNKN